MAVVLESERRSAKAKVFLALIYSALILGALTMIYPFAVMLSASTSSAYDYQRHDVVNKGLFSRSERFMRSVAKYFPTFPRAIYPEAPESWTTWQQVAQDTDQVHEFVEKELAPYSDAQFLETSRARADEALRALAEAPPSATSCTFDSRDIASFVKAKYGTIEALNEAWPIPHKSFFDISFSAESKAPPDRPRSIDEKYATWLELKHHYIEKAIENGDQISRTLPWPLLKKILLEFEMLSLFNLSIMDGAIFFLTHFRIIA